MTTPARSPSPPAAAGAVRPVVVSWADATGLRIAAALATLIESVFDGRVPVDARREDAGGGRLAAGGAEPLVITIDSVAAARRAPGAAAFISVGGGAFGFGDRLDAAARRTPQGATTLADTANPAAVRDVVRAIGVAAGDVPTDLDARFDGAWPAFAQVVERMQARTETVPSAAWWVTGLTIALAVGAMVAAGAWTLAAWPFGPPARPCQGLEGSERADCSWQQFVARHSTRGSGGNVALATQLPHRAFAIVERRTGCDQGSRVEEHHLVTQGDSVHGARIGAVSAAPPGTPSAAAPTLIVTLDDRTAALPQWICGGTHNAVKPRFIGTLSTTEICESLGRVRRTLPDRAGGPDRPADAVAVMVDLLSGYLATSGAAPRTEIQDRLVEWVSQCGVQ